MKTKKTMKKIIAGLLSLVLLMSASGLQNIVNSGMDKVQAAEDYTRLGLAQFGLETEQKTSGDFTPESDATTYSYSAGAGTLHKIEVDGMYKFGSYEFDNGYGATTYTRTYFGSTDNNFYVEYSSVADELRFGYKLSGAATNVDSLLNITKAQAEEVGLTFQEAYLGMSVKFFCATPSDANSNVTVTVTLYNLEDATKQISRTIELSSFPMSGLTREYRIASAYGCEMWVKPYDRVIEYTKLGLDQFGLSTEQKTSGNFEGESNNTTNSYSAGEGTLHEIEVDGMYKFGTYSFDNGYGAVTYTRTYFGSVDNNFYVEYSSVANELRFGQKLSGTATNLDSSLNITKAQAEEAGLTFHDNYLGMSVKFYCATPNAANSNVTVTVTLYDVQDVSKQVSRTIELSSFPMSGLTREYRIASAYGCEMWVKPSYDKDLNSLTLADFGIEKGGTLTNSSKMLTNDKLSSLENVLIEGVFNIPSGQSSRIHFGSADVSNGFYLDFSSSNTVSLRKIGVASTNYATDANIFVDMACSDYLGKDVTMNIVVVFLTKTDTTADIQLVITVDDVQWTSTKIAGVALTGLQPTIGLYTADTLIVKNTGVETLAVSGENTNAYNVFLSDGDALPTGYTKNFEEIASSDGKYILSWTANGSEVTTYDSTKTAYEAKFVDTKMLKVAKQHKVEDDGTKSVRFIATLDTLNYQQAGFLFANTDMGELTHDNKGAIVELNTAYKKLNANGTSQTPEERQLTWVY